MNYRLLDRGETMQEGDEALTGPKDEKWEPIPHWSIGMPYRSSNNPVRRALDVSLDAESVIERLQARIEHSAYFNGVRFARLWHWAHEELSEELKSRFFCIVANGTADHMEQPTYAQQFNMMKHRAERAEEALRDIADDYADRFDLDSPSTNPGIKSVVQQARAVLADAAVFVAAGVRVDAPTRWCPECRSAGVVGIEQDVCPTCDGTGKVAAAGVNVVHESQEKKHG